MPWRFITHQLEFDVLADLEDRAVLEQRLQRGERLAHRNLVLEQAAAEQVGRRRCDGRAARRRRGRASSPARSRRDRPASDRARWSWRRRRRCRPRAPRRSRLCSVGQVADADIGADVDLRGRRRASARSAASSDGGRRRRIGVARAAPSSAGARGAAGGSSPTPFGLRGSALPAPTSGPCASARLDLHRRPPRSPRGRCRSPRRRGGSAS